jgi:hypothetical protein
MPRTPGSGFLGRTKERERLDGLLATAREGRSGVLVLRGEAGIGKTALLRYAARQAAGFRVAQISGVEAEMELPFAGVHQLCAPVAERLDSLPEPQRDALRVAVGLGTGPAADRFLVGLAVLSLLAVVAEERPLLCLVDDAQWLDAASTQVLAFAARRLLAEPVALVFAVREPHLRRELDGLPVLPVHGLDDADARALLARVASGSLDDRVRDRIIGETHGNPLALLELSKTMGAAERAAGFGLPASRDLTGQIEAGYLRRVQELPLPSRQLMLVAAADPLGDASLVWRAAQRLGIGPHALAPAERAKLLEITSQVCFHHPLVRSAVYGAAQPSDRREVHLALADATDARGISPRQRRDPTTRSPRSWSARPTVPAHAAASSPRPRS